MKKNIKHILSQEKIGSLEWTDSVIKEADLFFDLIGNKDVYGEDYIDYLMDTMQAMGYKGAREDAERYYTEWLLYNEQRLDRAAKMGGKYYKQGGKIGEWDFKAEIQPSDIDLNNEKDYVKEQLLKDGIKVKDFDDIRPEKFYVEYNIEHELREYGIKSMGVNVNRVYGDIRAEWEDPSERIENNDVVFDVSQENREWNIVSKIDTNNESGLTSVSLYPTNLEVDFKEKKILITFKIS